MGKSDKLKGWIYVISNKALPGLVKVGYSTKDPNSGLRNWAILVRPILILLNMKC